MSDDFRGPMSDAAGLCMHAMNLAAKQQCNSTESAMIQGCTNRNRSNRH